MKDAVLMQQKAILEELAKTVAEGTPEQAERIASEALKMGIEPLDAIDEGASRGLRLVGERFEKGELFLTDLIMSAEAMKSCLAVLEPELKKRNRTFNKLGRIAIGTVAGDIHDIGKTIVASMLVASGFEVEDLGVDVATNRFLQTVKESKPDILGLSALLTATTPRQKDVMQALVLNDMRAKVLVIVGGGSVTQSWTDEIGADGYASDAVGATALARKLMKAKGSKNGRQPTSP